MNVSQVLLFDRFNIFSLPAPSSSAVKGRVPPWGHLGRFGVAGPASPTSCVTGDESARPPGWALPPSSWIFYLFCFLMSRQEIHSFHERQYQGT